MQANVATPGTADSFLRVTHVTRTRRAHQITASSLYHLLQKAYLAYCSSLGEERNQLSLEIWCSSKAKLYPQFKFWLLILQLELAVLVYVRAITEGDFKLYLEALTKDCSLVLLVGPWIPVHLTDMVTLKDVHPKVFAEFLKGNFVVKKTAHRFFAIATDQGHEQNNADGGAVGLTANPAALKRWMVSGPEMARVIGEFEASTEKRKKLDPRHHEEAKLVQKAFERDVRSLVSTIEEMGNPSTEDSSDLLALDSRDIADPAVIDTVRQIEKLGEEQYDTYVKERLVSQTKPFLTPSRRTIFPFLADLQSARRQSHSFR